MEGNFKGFGGFSINKQSKMTYGMAARSSSGGHMLNIGRKRVRGEDEYFEEDEAEADDLQYQPAPDSPAQKDSAGSSDSDDPLDQFMENIQTEVEKLEKKKSRKGKRDDIDNEDVQEAYFKYMEENPNAGVVLDEDDDLIDYDDDGNAIRKEKKVIDPLPMIDHSEVTYPEFNKNFYEEHDEINALTDEQVKQLREKLGIKVLGIQPPKPVSSFAHFGFDEGLMKVIRKQNYTQPTPIQAQGVPVVMGGRDIIGIAKTGSGKTAAYLWPMLVHVQNQPELQPGDGPIALIVAPTRELSQQIYTEARKFGKPYNTRVVCAYGGGSLYEQSRACEQGTEVIVATPGRLIELVKKKATSLSRVTYVVFDEADRMFNMGFEPQVRSIASHIQPLRQTLMFSATFRRRIERLARDILSDPVRVLQGDVGEANEDVQQTVLVLKQPADKWAWLTQNLVRLTTLGSVLIFVTRKVNCDELASNLKLRDFNLSLIHGDLSQVERNEVITAFKNKSVPILVATDVAARGLDISHIRTVVNYDVAQDIDTHTHRIGRTGRAGQKGTAYTLVGLKDREFAGHLVRNLEGANQVVSRELMELALQNSSFNNNRLQHKQPKKMNIGGAGLGFSDGQKHNQGSLKSISAKNSQQSNPRSDRVASLKTAFNNQFKNNFVTASDTDVDATWTSSNKPFSMYQEAPKKRKSRWE